MMRMNRMQRLVEAAPERRGAALFMSFFLMIVILAVAFQITVSTGTDARVARNDVGLTTMDLAIESALLEVFEILKEDLASGGDAGGGGGAAGLGALTGGDTPDLEGGGGDPNAGGESEGASDSRRDEWARTQRTQINEIDVTIMIQDENSKYNVLSMLTENEDEAEKALDRVARIIANFRKGTSEEIDSHTAGSMAEAMLEHLRRRSDSVLPRPTLITDDPEREDVGLALSLREFVALEEFEEDHFRDYRNEEGEVVHSLASFLTTWTSLSSREDFEDAQDETPGGGGGGAGGGGGGEDDDDEDTPEGAGGDSQAMGDGRVAGDMEGQTQGIGGGGGGAGAGGGGGAGAPPTINVNTAPLAVLNALMDDRDVDPRFWDEILEYRNEEDEEAQDEDADPIYDEYGKEIVLHQFFSSVEQLAELDEWTTLEPIVQAEINQMLDVTSDVFTIYIRAGRVDQSGDYDLNDPDSLRELEESGTSLTRSMRCVVWRQGSGESAEIVPIERWELLDYRPWEVLDYPDEER